MKDEPREIITKFCKAISHNKWEKAYQYCQTTWVSNNSIDKLKDYYDELGIKFIKIIKEVKINDYIYDFEVLCNAKFGKQIRKARLICESKPYHPDINGSWGINPLSFLRKIK